MKNKAHLLVICPEFYPINNGLSDYTTGLVENIHQSYDLTVLTHSKAKNKWDNKNISIVQNQGTWGFINIYKAFIKINRKRSVDKILIQYVPYMYGRAGINFSMPLFFFCLRFLFGFKEIYLKCHELWFPFLRESWKSWIIHYSHRYNIFFLVIASKKVFTTTEYFKLLLKEYYPLKRDRFFHLPVPANINSRIDESFDNTDNNKLNVVHFGGLHFSKNSNELFEYISEQVTNEFNLNFVGISRDDAVEVLGEKVVLKLDSFSRFYGKLSEEDVVSSLKKNDLLLAYFVDGASTRRGTLMAGLKFGITVLSTKTFKTDKILLQSTVIFDSTDVKLYVDRLLYLAKNPDEIKIDKKMQMEFYANHFDWGILKDKYIKLMRN